MNLDYDWPNYEQEVKHEIVKVKTELFLDPLYLSTNFPILGLHRPVEYFERKDYIECFMQSAVKVLELKNKAILVGGMGNKLSDKTILKMVRVAAGNGVKQVYMATGGLMTRPVMSYFAKLYNCYGFSVLIACPMEPNYDCKNIMAINMIDPKGWPINPHELHRVIAQAQLICCYNTVPTIVYSTFNPSHKIFLVEKSQLTLSVVDGVGKYAEFLKEAFDFDEISSLLNGAAYFRPFRILIDANNGAAGPYAKRIFEKELGGGKCIINGDSSDKPRTFHPSQVGSLPIDLEMKASSIDFGASLDADGSRCLIYGKGGFHIPVGETLAAVSSHYRCIPCFQKQPVNGVGRSFFTSSSVDDVVKSSLELRLVQTPGYWLYFNRLVDDKSIIFCEDDNFRIGSHLVGVSDGIWAILAWLTLVIHLYQPVKSIMIDHWTKYGRYFMTVYEFHGVRCDALDRVMHTLHHKTFKAGNFSGSSHTIDGKTFTIVEAGVFPFCFKTGSEITYEDTFLRVVVEPKGLITYRTVVVGNRGVFKINVEVHSTTIPCTSNKRVVTRNLFKLALAISKIDVATGKTKPDLIY